MRILTLMFLIIVFQFLGCYSSVQTDSKVPIIEKAEIEDVKKPKVVNVELERNRRIWNEKNILDYNMIGTADIGGNVVPARRVLIKVRDGKFVSIETNEPVDNVRIVMYEEYNTVNKIFDKIQKGFDEGAKVEVEYHKKFGYPEKLMLNYIMFGEDSWYGMKIEKFEIVE